MKDVIFIGNRRDACHFRAAGIESYCPEPERLVERVLAERRRCRVLAMTADIFADLPGGLARELREGDHPRLRIVTAPLDTPPRRALVPLELRALAARTLTELRA